MSDSSERPAPRSASPRRGRIRRLMPVALILGCAAGGAALSQRLAAKPAPPPEVAEQPDAHGAPDSHGAPDAHHTPEAHPVKPTPADLAPAGRIETYIRAGSYADALKLIRAADPGIFGDEYEVAYREGLCLEGMGKLKEADEAYQKAEQDPSVGGWARALLGRSRCELAEHALSDARLLLDRVLLRSGHPECRGGKVLEEAAHLRARIYLLEMGAPAAMDPLNADALAWPTLHVNPDAYLDWLTDAPTVSPSPDPGRDVVEVNRDKDPRNPAITLRLSKRPALEVLRALAAAMELEVSANDAVGKLLADLVGPVEVEQLPFDTVLSALTERVGVAWTIKDHTLHLKPAPRAANAELAGRALRQALELAPDHPAASAMRVSLANLDVRAGRFRAASTAYKQTLEAVTHAPAAPHAAYNLGLMELKVGHRKGAVARFLEVIDRSPGTTFSEFGWCWIGRAHLEGDDPGAARQAYVAAYNSKNKEASSAAALGVCMCDLLTGNEDAVRELLEDARFSNREPHAMVVNFYTALLRHRTAPSDSRKELLLRAMRAADDARALGPGGVYLVGRVYAELGLAREMTALYEREVETARGPLALRMLYDVAERYDRLDARPAARARYLSLAAVDPDGLGARAELKLAALDARDGNGPEAVRRCWGLTKNKNVPLADVLAVMGQGYELQKMHGAAAECFAGRLPE